MTKPSDIPQDVWDSTEAPAKAIYEHAFCVDEYDGFYLDNLITRIAVARAILAERERCARIAEEVDAWKGATHVATAIRRLAPTHQQPNGSA